LATIALPCPCFEKSEWRELGPAVNRHDWLQDGKHVERIYELALSNGRKVDPRTGKAPAVGSTVDLKSATFWNLNCPVSRD
jgi:hypothetical protein